MCFTVTKSLVCVTQYLVLKSGQRCLRTIWEVKNGLSLASESALAVKKSAGFEEVAL